MVQRRPGTVSLTVLLNSSQEAEAYFAKGNWAAQSGEVDLLKELSDLIILTASRCLLGKEARERPNRANAHIALHASIT